MSRSFKGNKTPKDKTPKECEFCVGQTKTGGICKRRAQCQSGCEYFCWQHAKSYGGNYAPMKGRKNTHRRVCSEPDINDCNVCLPDNTYPCKIGYHTLFFNEQEMKEHCDAVGDVYYDVKAMKKLAKQKTKEWRAEAKVLARTKSANKTSADTGPGVRRGQKKRNAKSPPKRKRNIRFA